MLPVITIVGRPNVGKSTLFNSLTKTRDALVADIAGVTRDRQYGLGVIGDRPYWVVDTGGIEGADDSDISDLTEQQVIQAIQESDIIFFVVDARAGRVPSDDAIATRLRSYSDKVYVLANKTDHLDPDTVCAEFFALGFARVHAIAARRTQNIKPLMAEVLHYFPVIENAVPDIPGIKIAIIGRPNVGKSTLINRLLGEERVIVLDCPGTTRDSIYIPYQYEGKEYVLIDTAGVRRQSKVTDTIEKLSLLKTMQAIQDADVVLMLLNAQDGIIDQDLRLMGMVVERGKAMVLAINKWDHMETSAREHIEKEIDRRFSFVSFARRYFISALHGTGVGLLYRAIDEAYASATQELSTASLTRAVEKAVEAYQPPLVRGRRVRLRFAHLGGHNPLTVIIHGKQTDALPLSYKKYLAHYLRSAFNLVGVPLVLHFKTDVNPYV